MERRRMSELQVIARYTISAGHEDEVLGLLAQAAEAARTEPGNLSFQVYREVGNDREVVLLERYDSPDAFAAHRETPHFRELVQGKIIPRLDNRVIETYNVSS
jgi:quinol monooxygenase YgiN